MTSHLDRPAAPGRPTEPAQAAARERQVTDAFVALTDSLVGNFDVVELLCTLTDNCARLLDVQAAGLLLADVHGVLHVMAASSDTTHNLQLLQLQREQGPGLDCYRTGQPVVAADLRQDAHRWPTWAAAADAAGVASVHALPMRLQDQPLGTLGLFGGRAGRLSEDDLHLGNALAHVASIAIVQDMALTDRDAVAEQLQRALASRVVLEQAKGVLAQHGDLSMDQAFARLRGYARDHNQRLTQTARAVAGRRLPPEHVLSARHRNPAG